MSARERGTGLGTHSVGPGQRSAGAGAGLGTHGVGPGLVLEAGDGDDVGPVIRLHEDPGGVGAGHVEGRGAVLAGALDASANDPLHPLPAVHAFLGAQRGDVDLASDCPGYCEPPWTPRIVSWE